MKNVLHHDINRSSSRSACLQELQLSQNAVSSCRGQRLAACCSYFPSHNKNQLKQATTHHTTSNSTTQCLPADCGHLERIHSAPLTHQRKGWCPISRLLIAVVAFGPGIRDCRPYWLEACCFLFVRVLASILLVMCCHPSTSSHTALSVVQHSSASREAPPRHL